jgi:hypothetical protein
MTLYRQAQRKLQPSSAEMAKRHALAIEQDRLARDSVKADILAGRSPQDLYDAECAKGGAKDKSRCVALIGVLRRGMSALL